VNIALPPALRTSPATRVAFGLMVLMVSLLLLIDTFVNGFLPNRLEEAKRHRLLATELIATQVTHALRNRSDDDLRALLSASVRRDPQLRSAAVVAGAQQRAVAGDHARLWRLDPIEPSTVDNVRAALLADGHRWGELQLAFTPAAPHSVWQWPREPAVIGVALLAALGFGAFQLYLRRAMRYLDPSAAVPERVRTAFDTLTEAVLVLDTDGRVMLANRAFRGLGPKGLATPIGASVDEFAWLAVGLPADLGLPWQRVLETNQPMLGIEMQIGAGAAHRREVVMNCTPINDGFRRARGCLVTLSDVTELHERTEGLRVALAELHTSREEIRLKNEELTLLATRDALTGCLNRRAFRAESERCIEAAARAETALCCIMCDVDHFKSINDRFGHGGGDEVLKAVAKALGRGLRTGDLLGRYGGEEFCIVLPDATLEQALVIAQRLRADVEANAGSAVRQLADVKVTMSFGVERLGPQAAQFAALVDRADQALYHSKKSGRNRVTAFSQMPREADPARS
jgi:diguanylate cyclase (GGDEF)-like protein